MSRYQAETRTCGAARNVIADTRSMDARFWDLGHEIVSLADRLRNFAYPADIIRDMALMLKLLGRVRRRVREERGD